MNNKPLDEHEVALCGDTTVPVVIEVTDWTIALILVLAMIIGGFYIAFGDSNANDSAKESTASVRGYVRP